MNRTTSSDQTVETGWKDKGMKKTEKLDLRDEVDSLIRVRKDTMERMGGQVNEKEKRRMSPKNRGHKGGRNSTSRSEDSYVVSSEGVSILYS